MGKLLVLRLRTVSPESIARLANIQVEMKLMMYPERHLYKLVSSYLKAHPTTEESPLKMPIRGVPPPKDKIPPPAIPRGFKIGTILPLHSPALSGGGVSDNMMQDMMRELQSSGGAPGGMSGMPDMSALMGALGGGGGGDGGGAGAGPKKVKGKR
jgi:signal recognition particle subunit SRP19